MTYRPLGGCEEEELEIVGEVSEIMAARDL